MNPTEPPLPSTPPPSPPFPAPRTPGAAAPTPVPDERFVERFDQFAGEYPELRGRDLISPPQRRRALPLVLFLATCASTFWVGAANWEPMRPEYGGDWHAVAEIVQANWRQGLAYMGALVGILLAHEMGHFLMTVRYGVPASYPLFIPVPFNPIGTMGAVIGMDGLRANRRQIFDIGVAGPLAGLVVAIPVLWYGVKQLDPAAPVVPGDIEFYLPTIGQQMLLAAHPEHAGAATPWIGLHQLNPCLMAGWVGMLITGLNMLPISQLDGGHVIYSLFLRRAHVFAQVFISLAILYVVVHLEEAVLWTPMLLLVIFLGIHHPPTANDRLPLGPLRWAIGLASLAIPVFCFPIGGLR